MNAGLISFERAKGFLRGFRWTTEQADELIKLIRAGVEPPPPTPLISVDEVLKNHAAREADEEVMKGKWTKQGAAIHACHYEIRNLVQQLKESEIYAR